MKKQEYKFVYKRGRTIYVIMPWMKRPLDVRFTFEFKKEDVQYYVWC